MPLADFIQSLDDLESEAVAAFTGAADSDALEAIRIEFLGAKNGRLKSVQQQMGTVDKTDKKAAGMRFNEAKSNVQNSFETAIQAIANATSGPQGPALDPTLPGSPVRIGHVHPVTQTIEHLKEIMGRMGFAVVEGPEVEDPWHNFVALNIPEDHPARDPLDNFYLATAKQSSGGRYSEGERLLRSQTSTVQIRVMEQTQPPVRVISLGRVYRPDEADATHYPMFHQMEGLFIDKGVTMANLKTVLNMFATSYLGEEVKVRFRPSFFPFTEPSVEVDYWWNDSWIEFGGAGMVDPAVLTSVEYDPEEFTGFAFGLGVERLCMRRHAVTDIRDLFSGDVRFLSQF